MHATARSSALFAHLVLGARRVAVLVIGGTILLLGIVLLVLPLSLIHI